MKRIALFIFALFTSAIAHAATETINWYMDDNTYATTTCQTGGDIVLPTAPTKYGYTFNGWKVEYTKIEYLESTGTQWIDTGILSNNQNEIRAAFSIVYSSLTNERNYVLGCYNAGTGRTQYSYSATAFFGWGALYDSPTLTLTTEKHNLVINKNAFILDDVTQYVPNSEDFSSSANIYLFASNPSDNVGAVILSSGVRIWQFRILKNNVLLRDFIPVLDPDGTPCMYDKVENKFYYNAGTGQFIAGPVINQ